MVSRLFILEGQDRGQCFNLEQGKSYAVGRSPQNDIPIHDRSVSRHHLTIRKKGKKYLLTDLDSENGTFANGKNIEPGIEVEVNEGTPIVTGMTIIGIGDTCESCLKPVLESIGICSQGCKTNEIINPHRTATFKKNLEFIYSLSNELMRLKDTHEILEKTADHILHLLKRIDRCVIMSTDKKTGKISDIIYKSRKPIYHTETVYNHQLIEKSLLLNKTIYISDSHGGYYDDNYELADTLKIMKIRSAMCIPIRSRLQTRGAIYVDTIERAYGFRMSDIPLLKDVSCRIAQVMDYIELREFLTNN